MRAILTLFILLFWFTAWSQLSTGREIRLVVFTSENRVLPKATVRLLNADSTLIRTVITDSSGVALFNDLTERKYLYSVSFAGYTLYHSTTIDLATQSHISASVFLKPEVGVLGDVRVVAKKTVCTVSAGQNSYQCWSCYYKCWLYSFGSIGKITRCYSRQEWKYRFKGKACSAGNDWWETS